MADNSYRQSKEDSDRIASEKRNQIGIVFENINTGEIRVASTVEHIAAFFNSSDEGPNAKNKQDMGWRLSPEDLIELEDIKNDYPTMEKIAAAYQIPAEDVADYNVLKYMASKRFASARRDAEAEGKDYESDYDRRVREAREGKKSKSQERRETTQNESKPTENVKPKTEEKVDKSADKADNGGNASK